MLKRKRDEMLVYELFIHTRYECIVDREPGPVCHVLDHIERKECEFFQMVLIEAM
jgi:hypothetical protein